MYTCDIRFKHILSLQRKKIMGPVALDILSVWMNHPVYEWYTDSLRFKFDEDLFIVCWEITHFGKVQSIIDPKYEVWEFK